MGVNGDLYIGVAVIGPLVYNISVKICRCLLLLSTHACPRMNVHRCKRVVFSAFIDVVIRSPVDVPHPAQGRGWRTKNARFPFLYTCTAYTSTCFDSENDQKSQTTDQCSGNYHSNTRSRKPPGKSQPYATWPFQQYYDAVYPCPQATLAIIAWGGTSTGTWRFERGCTFCFGFDGARFEITLTFTVELKTTAKA